MKSIGRALLLSSLLLAGCWNTPRVQPNVADPHLTKLGRQLLEALERYALQKDGHYPPPEDFPSGLVTYLEDGHLARCALCPEDVNQDNPLPVVAPLLPATAGKTPVIGTQLGVGTMPVRDRFTDRTFGAFIYDATPDTQHFVLYGVTRGADGQAVLGFSAAGPN